MATKASECVKVVVRCRPMNSREISDQRSCVVRVDSKRGDISVDNLKGDSGDPKTFTFDLTYAPDCT